MQRPLLISQVNELINKKTVAGAVVLDASTQYY